MQALEEFCEAHSLSPQVKNAADLALEEHLTNVATHGKAKEMTVKFRLLDGDLVIDVEDNGKSYDPLKHPVVDTTRSLEDMPIGGLGIHLIRQFMDELSYRQTDGWNVLRMRKRLAA